MRWWAEMEMDDLRYGLDHGLGVKQVPPGYWRRATGEIVPLKTDPDQGDGPVDSAKKVSANLDDKAANR